MRLSRGERLFLLLLFLAALILSLLLYRDFRRTLAAGSARVVGTITFKQKQAQRRYSSQVIWENLEQSVPLYNRDAIRTGDGSEAIIKLNDGTTFEMDENSMLVLNIREKTLDVNFQYGSVQAKGSTGGTAEGVTITSGDKKIALGKGDVNLSQKDNQGLNLNVSSGEVTVQSGDKQEKVQKDQTALLSDRAIQVEKIGIVPEAPAMNSRYFTEKPRLELPFQWKSETPSPVVVEVSESRNFRTVAQRVTSADGKATISLPAGTYYWRLAQADRGAAALRAAAVYRFIILAKKPLHLMVPEDNRSIRYVTNIPFVNFIWGQNELASGYRLEIAKDPEFQNTVRTMEGITTSMATQLTEGDYYWRVVSRSPIPEAAVVSETRRFHIEKETVVEPPRPVRPANGLEIGKIYLQKDGIVFNWIQNSEIDKTDIWISSDRSFADGSTIHRVSTTNFITIQADLAPGEYFWKLRGSDRRGVATADSAITNFRVTEGSQILAINPPENEGIDALTARNNGILFTWNKPVETGNYRLTISKAADLSDPVHTFVSGNRSKRVRDLQEGLYYWQVSLLDSSGDPFSKSNLRSFRILAEAGNPRLIFPSNTSVVDMSLRETLPFQWEAVPRVESYTFRLYHIKDGKREKILERKTNRSEFQLTDLTLLDTGSFAWSVSAERVLDGKAEEGSEIMGHFTIVLGELPAPNILTPEMQFLDRVAPEKDKNDRAPKTK